MIYLLDKNQEVVHLVPTNNILELWQEVGINEIDTLNGSMILSAELRLKMDETYYIGIADLVDRHSFNIYKVIKKELTNTEIIFQGIQLAFDELAGKGYVRDIRPENETFSSLLGRLLADTGWTLGFVDSRLPRVKGSFYYLSRLEAIGNLINMTGAELKFKVAISNNEITEKYVEAYVQMGENTGKRFTYGTNALSIVAEEDTADLFTAILGRGRGEEISSGEDNPSGNPGYGRKITFEDVEWKKSDGDPVDKPLGQEYVEIPEATEMFGYPDGSPRLKIMDYSEIEEPEELLMASYMDALEYSRPKAQFKTSVDHVGELHIGDTVSIIRYDLDLKYQARVFSAKYNRLNIGASEINIGDVLIESHAKRQANFRKQVSKEIRQIDRDLEATYVVASNGTRVTFSETAPEVKKVNDIWYEEMPNGNINIRVWNGNEWIIEVSNAFSSDIQGRLDEIEDMVDAVGEKAQGTIDDINAVVTGNGFTTLEDLFASKIGTNEANTLFYQEAEAIGLVYNEGGVQKAIIGIQDGLPYIKGEHVILDGNTIVDGTFEVTEGMLASDAVIGQLKSTGIDASEIQVINLTVDSITGGSIDLAKGFRIINNGNPILEVDGSTGEVKMNISKLTINAMDVEDELKRIEDFEDGKSAYEIAVENGFRGSEADWLNSLKGEDGKGIPGEPGKDGKTTYTWVKYADDVNGGGMSDSPKGKRFIGLAFNKTTQTESTNASEYQWSEMPQNIEIGGRNLIQGTSDEWVELNMSTNVYFYRFGTQTLLEEGKTYTFSIEVEKMSDDDVQIQSELGQGNGDNYAIDIPSSHGGGRMPIPTDGERYHRTFTSATNANMFFAWGLRNNQSATKIRYRRVKLEKGNIATDWTEAPEDTQAKIDEKTDETVTNDIQEKLGDFITVEGYEEEIGEINSALQSYRSMLEAGEVSRDEAIEDITNLLDRTAVIETNLGAFTSRWNFLETSIVMGDDGLLVGDISSDTGIRISSGRIDFIDNGILVAEITGQYMQINRGIFVESAQIGEHQIETISGGHTIWKWMG